jgi:hypothetical protein
MRILKSLPVIGLAVLVACGGEPGPNAHDTKYRVTNQGQCVEDTETGLLWEVKSAAAGLHDWRNTYTWLNPEEANDALDYRGVSRDELFSISDLTRAENPPTANTNFFPYMQAAEYWTRFDYGTQHESAWAWSYQYGHDRVDWKRSPKHVRLVRGMAGELETVKE